MAKGKNRESLDPSYGSVVQRALSETSEETWRRWGVDRDRREVQRRINKELEAREFANLPIYPRECAVRLAEDTRSVAPDWRHIRPDLGPAWSRLLKAQVELTPEITDQREATITAVFKAVPRHLQPAVADLRILIDLLLIGHEAAAYQVGFEAGRLNQSAQEDERGRVRHSRRQRRKQKISVEAPLRLSLADKGNS